MAPFYKFCWNVWMGYGTEQSQRLYRCSKLQPSDIPFSPGSLPHLWADINYQTTAKDSPAAVEAFCDFCMTFQMVYSSRGNHKSNRCSNRSPIGHPFCPYSLPHLWADINYQTLLTTAEDPPAAVEAFCDFCWNIWIGYGTEQSQGLYRCSKTQPSDISYSPGSLPHLRAYLDYQTLPTTSEDPPAAVASFSKFA